jgi:TRAP-type C4-dicarboxylate transport system permease small subunit
MNENEKNLFYSVLKEQITEDPPPELTSNIMHIVHQKVHKKMVINSILRILGFVLLGTAIVGFVYGYLFWYNDFKLPSLNITFKLPAPIYMMIMSVVFVFSLIELYFRRKLYKTG